MAELRLEVLDEEILDSLLPWFDDEPTQAALGGREWVRRALRLMASQPGMQDGDRMVEDRVVWVAYEEDSPVGLMDVETYSDGSASFAYVVAPDQRGRGLCPRLVRAVIGHPRVAAVRAWATSVEPDNAASTGCLKAAGFRQISEEPDEDDMIEYELVVTSPGSD